MNATTKRRAAGIALLVVVLVLAPAGLAAKGGNGANSGHGGNGGGGNGGNGGSTTSSLALRMVTDVNGNGGPNWGDTVTFDVSTTATTEPYVDLTCSQNGVVVYGATSGFFASYPWPWTKDMPLGSQMWTGGDAACAATLYMFYGGGKKQTLATLQFTAYA